MPEPMWNGSVWVGEWHTHPLFSVQPSSGQGAAYGVSDDDEIRVALLEEDEVEFKTIIWTNENKDWLEAQEGGLFVGEGNGDAVG